MSSVLSWASGNGVLTPDDIERFKRKTELDGRTGCLIWKGAKCSGGYGAFRLGGRTIGAHRVSWTIHTGESPGKYWVLHLCHRRDCVQPGHLALGTPLSNTWSMILADRQARRDGL